MARAQSCNKAKTLSQRAECGGLTLPETSDQITLIYQKLLHKLKGSARDHLIKDQERWVATRNREHLNPANTLNSYVARVTRLKELLDGLRAGPYPFVGDYVIVRNEKFKYGGFHADAHYPQFDGGGVDAAASNRYFLNMARSGISRIRAIAAETFNSPPFSPGGYGVAEYEYSQDFTLSRPGPALITVALWTSTDTGGVHANVTDAAYLINLHTDAFEPLDRVFSPGVDWRHQLAKIATDDYNNKYGSSVDQYYGPAEIMAVLADPSNYVFEQTQLTILLNYDLPDFAFSIQIPYTQIRHLLRLGGPIAVSAQSH